MSGFFGIGKTKKEARLKAMLGDVPTRQFGSVALLMAQISDDDIERAHALIAQSVDLILKSSGGMVFHMVSAIIISTFDFGVNDFGDAQKECERVANLLHQTLGDNVKILFGTCEGNYLNLGSGVRMQFGPFIKGMDQLLKRLIGLKFGSIDHF
jgi:hypothetical protein